MSQTTKKSEMELLLKLLPRYYEHVKRYPHTFLIKFFGLHRVTTLSGGKVHPSSSSSARLPISPKHYDSVCFQTLKDGNHILTKIWCLTHLHTFLHARCRSNGCNR